ncbi:hypothetical protein PG997_001810 [Apiospora hydei]|uniref:LysM domain-containing protein n=1 Tax=Apiospora hydei TaxID=1337664 RepID=A0ABR1X7J4_9PEZI
MLLRTGSFLFLASLLAGLVQAQVQLYNLTLTPDVSETCVAVINQPVNCDAVLASLGDATPGNVFGTPLFLTPDRLDALCTADCRTLLLRWEVRIARACGDTLYDQADGGKHALASYAHKYIEIYDTVCLKNSDSHVCNTVMGDLLGIDPVNQHATATPTPQVYCDGCFLSMVSTQLAMPLASTSLLADMFSGLTSSCSSSGWTIAPTPTATTFTVRAPSTTPEPPGCNGTMYTVASSDTCVGISLAQGISTDDLASYNHIPSMCYRFPNAGTSLCLPDARKCQPYKLTQNDTCTSLRKHFGITYAQLTSWNPSIGRKCNNLAAYVGYVLCVSNPGGDWVNPEPGQSTPMEAWPSATYVPFTEAAPYANGTRMDCATYVTAPMLTNYTGNGTTSLACADVADQYGIALDDFLTWNPSLNSSDPCTMANNTQYCVQSYARFSQGMTDSCVQTETAPPGYDCYKFTADWGVDSDQFAVWNPDVGPGCQNFTVGKQYCISVLHFQQPGIAPNCNQFAAANETDWVNLPCQIIETKFGLSHARTTARQASAALLGTSVTGSSPSITSWASSFSGSTNGASSVTATASPVSQDV